jgi:hypothetical protein
MEKENEQNLDEKLKNLKEIAMDAKVARTVKKQTSKDVEQSTGTVELSRDEEFIKGVEGEDKTTERRFQDDGYTIEPFNLQNENDEGFYDIEGNYVRHSKKGEEFDAWNDGLEDHEMKMKVFDPKLIHKKPEKVEEPINPTELMQIICEILLDGENVKQALKRLAPVQKFPKTKKNQKIEKNKEIKVNLPSSEDFNKLTDAAYKLSEDGYIDVYDDKKEIFISKLKPKETEQVNWEYKWVGGNDEIFGPFSTQQMKEWSSLGYFQTPLMVRKVNDDIFGEEEEFVPSEKFFPI